VCGARRLSRRGDRRLVGARFGRWREETFGQDRCLTLRYSLPLSVWVDPVTEHIHHSREAALARRVGGTVIRRAEVPARARIHIRDRIDIHTIGCTRYIYV